MFSYFKGAIFLGVLLVLLPSYFSAVEDFSRYNTKITFLENDTLQVSKEIFLRNIHEVGIVPGQVEFKIFHQDLGEETYLKNFTVTNRYGEKIPHQIFETNEYSLIILTIFTPVLPGFEYQISMDYLLNYDSSGLLFKSMEVPFKEESQIPIRSGTIEIELPEKYSFTYLNYRENLTFVEPYIAKWSLQEDSPQTLQLEYSSIPISTGSFPSSLIFWIVVNCILFLLLAFEVRKEIKKIPSKKK